MKTTKDLLKGERLTFKLSVHNRLVDSITELYVYHDLYPFYAPLVMDLMRGKFLSPQTVSASMSISRYFQEMRK